MSALLWTACSLMPMRCAPVLAALYLLVALIGLSGGLLRQCCFACRSPRNKKALSRIFGDNSKPKILALVPEVSRDLKPCLGTLSISGLICKLDACYSSSLSLMPCLNWHCGAVTVSLSCPTEVGILLQSNKKVDEFRTVLTKVTTERKEKYNVLWADPKASPQVSSLLPCLSFISHQYVHPVCDDHESF